MAFEGCQVGNYGKHPTVRIFWKQTRLYENFNHDSYRPHFLIWEKLKIYEFCAIPYATQASLPNGASQGAYIVCLSGKNNMVVPIAWQSKKICRVTKSMLELETLSLSEVADAGFMIASMVQEINFLSSLPIRFM